MWVVLGSTDGKQVQLLLYECFLHVDNCLIFSPKKEHIDELVKELTSKFTIEDEGDISTYLGINITCPTADTIKIECNRYSNTA